MEEYVYERSQTGAALSAVGVLSLLFSRVPIAALAFNRVAQESFEKHACHTARNRNF